MTTDSKKPKKDPGEVRPVNLARGSSGFPEGWPKLPSNLPVGDRPIVAKNLANKAQQIGPTPSMGAKKILNKTQSKRVSGKLVKHRCFDLPYDEKKERPGRKGTKGKSEADTWIAKTSDWRAIAEAAFELLHPNDPLEGFKWRKFEREVFQGVSFLSDDQINKTSTKSADLILGLINKLVEITKSTGIEKLWERLSDTPFDVNFDFAPDENIEEEGVEQTDDSVLGEEQVLSLGLGKLVRVSPLDGVWQIGEVQPEVTPYWAEVSIELGRVAVPSDLWVLEIPRELRSQFTAGKSAPLPDYGPDNDDGTRFPDDAHEWLLKNGWNGTLPDNQWDLEEWVEDVASVWKKKTFHFDCRLMMTVNRGLDGEAQTQLEVRPSSLFGGDDRMFNSAVGTERVLKQLGDPDAGHVSEIHRLNDDFWPEVIYDNLHRRVPVYWTAFELENAADDLRRNYVLDELTLSETLDLLGLHPFAPSIKVSEQARLRQFPKGTVLDALFANLALGDSPDRLDRLLKAQAQAITEFGNNHLDELVSEAQLLLDQLD